MPIQNLQLNLPFQKDTQMTIYKQSDDLTFWKASETYCIWFEKHLCHSE